jgi:1-aminocyclopropane-1-carboxylate deaminase/D-cysteine desulfhydrase-like pyridoxal-dependent ACC family enzyme
LPIDHIHTTIAAIRKVGIDADGNVMDNLAKALGTDVNLWLKRNDYTGLALGGNKARPLEFYVGDA